MVPWTTAVSLDDAVLEAALCTQPLLAGDIDDGIKSKPNEKQESDKPSGCRFQIHHHTFTNQDAQENWLTSPLLLTNTSP